MKIQSYEVSASAQRTYTKVESKSQSISFALNQQAPKMLGGVSLNLSDKAKKMIGQSKEDRGDQLQKLAKGAHVDRVSSRPSDPHSLKLRMLEEMFYALTGRRFSSRFAEISEAQHRQPTQIQNPIAMGAQFTSEEALYEYESLSYQAQATINTADGRSISVDISLNMSREFMSYSSSSMTLGSPVDPLVINYGGSAASLTGQKFEFDLDFDGTMDQISFAAAGSGFLALDKNGDGTINNGSELFGPGTGSGFGELRAYDNDGNGWIDESDSIFDHLLIWSKDENGIDQLFKLKELDIGAIFLGDIETEFSLNDSANNTHGVMRSTSFFLKESGGAGTISHVDLML